MKACVVAQKTVRENVWTPVPQFKGNVGFFSPCELKRRCQGTGQYNPFWRAIYCVKRDGNGKGLKKEAVQTRLLGRDPSAAGGRCDHNPYLKAKSEPRCKRHEAHLCGATEH